MTYLTTRLIVLVFKAIMWSVVVALTAVGFCLIVFLAATMVLGMFTDAFIESIVAGAALLASKGSLQDARRAFCARFSSVATRYSNWGHGSLRKAH